jgi:hypothetical protein
MGISNALRLFDRAGATTDHPTPKRPDIASPWSDGTLESLIWSDLLGLDLSVLPPTRGEGMSVAALARARNILCPVIARCPLVNLRVDEAVDPQPAWMQRTDQLSSPFHRMLWTVDDQLWYGESLWYRDENSTVDGRPLKMTRVPYWEWDVNADNQIEIAGDVAAADQVVYLPGPHEGILNFGGRAIRGATLSETSALAVSQRPFRVELHQTTDEPMDDDEIARLVSTAKVALSTNDGILFTNNALQAIVHPFDSSQLLVEGRNANDVNMARLASLPASLVDANTAGSSLTYETSAGRNQQAIDYGFAAYQSAIASRLSMDDVVTHGTRIAFELTDLVDVNLSTTGPPTED